MLEFPKHVHGYIAEFTRNPKPGKEDSNRHILRLCHEEEEVANLRWDYNDEYVWVIQIMIKENYRRSGIGAAIYDCLQSITGKPLKWQLNALSPEMKCFVQKYILTCESILVKKN